jgi:translation initiation factor 1 (eIF-1/SUI1)
MITFSFDVQDKQEVVIEKIVRNNRKCVTVVKGLELLSEWFSVEIQYVRVKQHDEPIILESIAI